MSAPTRYRILGRLGVRVGSQWVPPAGLLATALAILLVNAGRPVASGQLARGVWPDPPPSSGTQLHKLMSELKKLLRRAGCGHHLINRRGFGYELAVLDHELDALLFRRLVTEADRERAAGQTGAAYARLRDAMALWGDDPPLLGIDSPMLAGPIRDLHQRRVRAAEGLLVLALERHDYRVILDEAPRLIESHPAREWLWEAWILGLYRAGDRKQASAEYERFESVVDGPNPLWDLGNAVYRADDAAVAAYEQRLIGRHQRVGARAPAADPLPLPAGLPDLVGRQAQLDEARWLLSQPGRLAGPLVLTGPAGVGKTALATQIAHQLRGEFPDGVLFVELLGTGPQPANLDEVLARLLRALGVSAVDVPAGRAERVALYQRRLAGKPVLVVLDDAPDTATIADLLPPDPAGAAIVTSQDRLAGLAGAHRITLDMLDLDDSVALLRRAAGEGGVAADDDLDGIRRVAEVCGGLPLALRVAGAQRATYRNVSWTILASWIVQGNLDMLVHADLSVPAAIAASYERLDGPARTLLRRLVLLDLPEFGAWVAAAVFDTTAAAAAELLTRLASRSLLRRTGTDHIGGKRYRLHNLVRRYARQEADRHEDRPAVLARGYGALLALAEHAHRRICGGDFEIVHGTAQRWHLPASERDRLLADPLAWYEVERANLRAAIAHAAQSGMDELSWDLAISAHEFYGIRSWLDDWHETHSRALSACRAAGNTRGEAAMLATLGQPALVHGRPDAPGADQLGRAAQLFAGAGDRHGEAIARRALGSAHRLAGSFAEAQHEFTQARLCYQDGGDPLGAWQAARLLGQTWLDLGDPDQALRHLEEALVLARATRHERAEPQTSYWIGRARLALGDLAGAADRFRRVLATAEAAGDRAGVAYGRHGLGDAAHRAGQWTEAAELLGGAREAARLAGDAVLEGRILCSLGELHCDRSAWRKAGRCLAEAAARFDERNASWLRAQALRRLDAVQLR